MFQPAARITAKQRKKVDKAFSYSNWLDII